MQILEPRKGSMLHMLWPALAEHFEAAALQAQVPSRSDRAAPAQCLRRLPSGWSPPPAAPAVMERPLDVVDVQAQRPIFDWVGQTSRHVGTLVHRELERAMRSGIATRSQDIVRLCTELAELGVPPARCEDAAARVVEAVARIHADPRGRWLLGLTNEISEAESELALTGMLQGQLVQGVIDRTFLDAQGTRWIVDFKTSTHEGGGLEAFLDEEVVRYRPQLQRYAQLMQRWRPAPRVRMALYFPLLGAWREIDPA